jgi:hypothetical protein
MADNLPARAPTRKVEGGLTPPVRYPLWVAAALHLYVVSLRRIATPCPKKVLTLRTGAFLEQSMKGIRGQQIGVTWACRDDEHRRCREPYCKCECHAPAGRAWLAWQHHAGQCGTCSAVQRGERLGRCSAGDDLVAKYNYLLNEGVDRNLRERQEKRERRGY